MPAPLLGSWAVAVGAVVLVAGAAGVAAARWGRRVPLWVVLLVALALRVAVAVLTHHHTPPDVGITIHKDADRIGQRLDPTVVMPRYNWNFLPLVPTLTHLLGHLGLSWDYTDKLPEVVADLVVVVLIGRFAVPARRRAVQWLYATNPVALLVCGLHGQVEPLALALGLTGLLLARRRPAVAGFAVGCAIAAKTWPVLFIPGLLRAVRWRRWWQLALGGAVALGAFVAEALFFLGDDHRLHAWLTRLAGYRSYLGTWGWTGLLRLHGIAGMGYAGPDIDRFQTLGSAILLPVLVVVWFLLRRRPAPMLVLGLMAAFYAATAGFGVQYLLWCVPFALTQVRRSGALLVTLASAYCLVDYLYVLPVGPGHSVRLATEVEVYASLPVIAAALVVLVDVLRPRPPVATDAAARTSAAPVAA